MKNKKLLIVLKWGALLGIGLSALQYLRTISDYFDYFAFTPILDLLLVIFFIGTLYLGIREDKDRAKDGNIKFSKAYLTGSLITFIAFFVVFFYFLLYYSLIDQNALSKLNERNRLKYWEQTESDTVKKSELTAFLEDTKGILEVQKILHSEKTQTECSGVIDNLTDTLFQVYQFRMEKGQLNDSIHYVLKHFDPYAKKIMMEITESINTYSPHATLSCLAEFNQIVQATVKEIQNISILQIRYYQEKDKIPQYNHTLAAALFFSLSVIIYGLLFNIFVSLYLFRNKKEHTDTSEEIEENTNHFDNNN